MDKVTTLYTPIKATITPNGGPVNAGSTVTIDTNVPATVVYTLDGSEPRLGFIGSFRADAPVDIELRVPARIRYRAFGSQIGRAFNQTRMQEASFTVVRNNPLEAYRDTSNVFRRLVRNIVDQNFYLTEGKWLVPTSSKPFTYAFVNREPYSILLRVLHNGIDVFQNFPVVAQNAMQEVPIRPTSGENTIEIQTEQV